MRKIPRLPVAGWATYSGARASLLPGVTDAQHQLFTISGRAAISLALNRLGAGPGTQVLVPTYHCTTMIEPVVRAGLTPRFYPLTATGAPDLSWLGEADISGVSAIIAAHFFGIPQPMAGLRRFCDAQRIALIEDCAHAFFGTADGRPVGTWGDLAIASLTKFFPVPEGGMLLSNTLPLDALDLRTTGLRGECAAFVDIIELGARFHRFAGLNWLLGCAFALKRVLRRSGRHVSHASGAKPDAPDHKTDLRLLDKVRPAWGARRVAETAHRARIIDVRRRNYVALAAGLKDLKGARAIRADLPVEAAPYVFPLYVDDAPGIYQRLRASGVPVFCWDEHWPDIPSLPGDHGTDWAQHVFQIGCHQDLSADDVAWIVNTVRAIVEGQPMSGDDVLAPEGVARATPCS